VFSKKTKSKKQTNKKYQIQKSLHGPLISYNQEIFFLDQPHQLFDIVDQYPEILEELSDAILEHIKTYIDPLIESIEERKNHDVMQVISEMNVVHNYFRFVFYEYPAYRKSLTETILGTQDIEASVALNDEKINNFYKLYEQIDKQKYEEYVQHIKNISEK